MSALLGSAGSVVASAVEGWLFPVLLCAAILLLGRSFWVLYIRGVRTPATVIAAWGALCFMVFFWSAYVLTGGWGTWSYVPGGETGLVSPGEYE